MGALLTHLPTLLLPKISESHPCCRAKRLQQFFILTCHLSLLLPHLPWEGSSGDGGGVDVCVHEGVKAWRAIKVHGSV